MGYNVSEMIATPERPGGPEPDEGSWLRRAGGCGEFNLLVLDPAAAGPAPLPRLRRDLLLAGGREVYVLGTPETLALTSDLRWFFFADPGEALRFARFSAGEEPASGGPPCPAHGPRPFLPAVAALRPVLASRAREWAARAAAISTRNPLVGWGVGRHGFLLVRTGPGTWK